MRFDDTKITPDTACWWPFARRQLLRKPHEILEAENKNKKQISASLCLATKQRYNLTYIKKKSFIFVCGLVISETPWSETASLSWLWEGQGRNEFSQSTQGNYSRMMSCSPWMIKCSHDNSSHLCISLLFPASTVWFFQVKTAMHFLRKSKLTGAVQHCFVVVSDN